MSFRPLAAAAASLLVLAQPALAQAPQPLQQRVEAKLREAGAGTRFGLVVATEDGRELVAIAPEQRFIPASNTKIFTTAAAFATFSSLDSPDAEGGAEVNLEGLKRDSLDVILTGHGDARLSSAPDCAVDCLSTLADAVAASTRKVRRVIGNDGFFPDQRWSPGMSWNNLSTRSGTAASALTLDDNELVLLVAPGAVGSAPRVDHLGYYTLDNRAVTVAEGKTDLSLDRLPGSRTLLLTGTILASAAPERLRASIDDPAHYAAWRLKALLEARGVKVAGPVEARHWDLPPVERPRVAVAVPDIPPLARLTPPPLAQDIVTINKVSHNLHAELLLRRIGRRQGGGSIADGLTAVRAMLAEAGVARWQYDFSDGSGMSTYNRIAPRGAVTFLRWVGRQPWGSAWRSTLPIAGVDGTLAGRFRGTSLERRLFAKTGSLNATSALSGYMVAKSGRTLVFAAYANDVPEGASATRVIDAALELIAQEN